MENDNKTTITIQRVKTMRPLPKRIETFAGRFEVVTDRAITDDRLDDDEDGIVWYREQRILIDAVNKSLRSQWVALLHEFVHVIEVEHDITLSEQEICIISVAFMDFLERNGFLDDPHRRGFYERSEEGV